ncbi:MAG: methyltransferase domain-containing protein [Elusimicrobia bacterium]|nr:methyltransferase domain-containing protein [Elusimicrobiota bacterium]
MTSPHLEEVACNLCGGKRSRTLFERAYALESLSDCAATTDTFGHYGRIVRCVDCGFVYTNPRPTKEALLAGYGACVDETYLEEASSRSINAHLSLNVIKRFAKGGRLLEIGCATGYFLNAARVDFEVAGLEPSEWASKTARERFMLDVYSEPLDTCRFPSASFDVVVMIDVVEHLTDPKAALRCAANWLKPGGALYLVTPDIGSLSASLLGAAWWGLRPAHIAYFDRDTMRRMLEEAGFEVVLEKSFGRIFSWSYWASRLKNYPAFVHRAVLSFINLLDIADKPLYLDTRDSMEICARKR